MLQQRLHAFFYPKLRNVKRSLQSSAIHGSKTCLASKHDFRCIKKARQLHICQGQLILLAATRNHCEESAAVMLARR